MKFVVDECSRGHHVEGIPLVKIKRGCIGEFVIPNELPACLREAKHRKKEKRERADLPRGL